MTFAIVAEWKLPSSVSGQIMVFSVEPVPSPKKLSAVHVILKVLLLTLSLLAFAEVTASAKMSVAVRLLTVILVPVRMRVLVSR